MDAKLGSKGGVQQQQHLELGKVRNLWFFEGFGYFGDVVDGHFCGKRSGKKYYLSSLVIEGLM